MELRRVFAVVPAVLPAILLLLLLLLPAGALPNTCCNAVQKKRALPRQAHVVDSSTSLALPGLFRSVLKSAGLVLLRFRLMMSPDGGGGCATGIAAAAIVVADEDVRGSLVRKNIVTISQIDGPAVSVVMK